MQKNALRLVAAAALLATLAACGDIPIEEFGALKVSISTGESTSKTILPDAGVEIATYDVSVSGPGPTDEQEASADTPEAYFVALASGMWTVSVFGRDSAGEVVASATTTVEVVGSELAETQVTVRPLDGTGNLVIAISWPPELLLDPSVESFLLDTDAGGRTDLTAEFDSDKTSVSAARRVPAGTYTLVVRITIGDDTSVWTLADPVQVATGELTALVYQLAFGDMSLGDVQVTIDEQMDDPFEVTIAGIVDPLQPGTDQQVTALTDLEPDVAADLTYQWYLDAEPIAGATGPDLVIGSNLQLGSYALSVVATRGKVLGSAAEEFSVEATATGGSDF